MGTWSTAFYGDDLTCDVRDDYLHNLRLKDSPEEAVKKLVAEFQPDADPDEGYLFWLALADIQWKYGHLTQELREKVLAILATDADSRRWEEASAADRKKRVAVLKSLRERLASPQPAYKKVAPYRGEKSPWKVGDMISIRFGLVDAWIQHAATNELSEPEKWRLFHGKYGVAQVVTLCRQENEREQVVNEYPVLVMYDWVGDRPIQWEEAEKLTEIVPFSSGGKSSYCNIILRPGKADKTRDEICVIGNRKTVPNKAKGWTPESFYSIFGYLSIHSCSSLYYSAIEFWVKSGYIPHKRIEGSMLTTEEH